MCTQIVILSRRKSFTCTTVWVSVCACVPRSKCANQARRKVLRAKLASPFEKQMNHTVACVCVCCMHAWSIYYNTNAIEHSTRETIDDGRRRCWIYYTPRSLREETVQAFQTASRGWKKNSWRSPESNGNKLHTRMRPKVSLADGRHNIVRLCVGNTRAPALAPSIIHQAICSSCGRRRRLGRANFDHSERLGR